jgi:transcriptional regulator with XRE-family HTH domain
MKKRYTTFATLKAWRAALALSQEAAAAKLCLSQPSYSRFENRVRAPKAKLAKAISDKTGVPLESVLGL